MQSLYYEAYIVVRGWIQGDLMESSERGNRINYIALMKKKECSK